MKIATSPPRGRVRVDYVEMARIYNALEIGGAVEMDTKVSNITVFTKTIEGYGLKKDSDFIARSNGDKTYVVKKSPTTMRV